MEAEAGDKAVYPPKGLYNTPADATIQPKKEKIKNAAYKQFLTTGEIKTITEHDIKKVLDNINRTTRRHKAEARALMIVLYYTGCRPTEALRLRGRDFEIVDKKKYLKIALPASKRGLARPVFLSTRKELIKELFYFVVRVFPDAFVFYNYRSKHVNKRITARLNSGRVKVYNKDYPDLSARLPYYFNRWFAGIEGGAVPPYFLRHNRFTKLSEAGADLNELRQLKGSKSFNSILPYLHVSTRAAKRLSQKIE